MTQDETSEPFAVQAAKAAWICPLLVVALMVMSMGAMRSAGAAAQTIRQVLAGVDVVLLAGSLICGIIGLAGVRKHGSKQILLPALSGIILTLSFVALTLWSVMASQRSAEWKRAYLEEQAADEEARLERRAATPGFGESQ